MRRSAPSSVALAAGLCFLLLAGAACSRGEKTARPPATDSKGSVLPPELQPPADEGDDEDEVTTTTRPPRSFSVMGSGDILLHNNVIQSGAANATARNPDGSTAYNFDPMFDDVREFISSADLAICHQETPIAIDNKNLTVPRTLSFNAPREIATALKNAGFDACDTASNHTWDRLLAGVKSTLDVLDSVGIKHTGSARDQAESELPPIHDVKGVKVGQLAYSYDIYNTAGPDKQVPPEAPWLRNFLWPALGIEGIKKQVDGLRARGAEFIVVSIHWGDQYIHEPNKDQRQMARDMLTIAGVDLILGDHVHVVQPCEKIGDKYVIYGMGNFLSNQSPTQDSTLVNANQDGSMHRFDVTETAPGVFKVVNYIYAPTWVTIPGHHIRLATPQAFPDSYKRTVDNMNLLNTSGTSTSVTTAKPGTSAAVTPPPAPACDAKPAF